MAAGLLLLLCSSTVQALTIKLSLAELTDMADTVVVGTVVSSSSQWNAEHNNIYTEVVVSVTDSLKGSAGNKTITIIVPGGTVGDITQWVEDTSTFEAGEQVGLFLEDLNIAKVSQMGLDTAFRMAADGSVGRIIGGLQGKQSLAKDNQPPGRGISADKFKHYVQIALTGKPVPEEENQPSLELETSNLLNISSISPSSASAGTGTLVTVTGSGFGTPDAAGSNGLEFFYLTSSGVYNNVIVPVYNFMFMQYDSWSDTQITAYVPWCPTGCLPDTSYPYSAASGPVMIRRGNEFSSPIDFTVTFGYGNANWFGNSPNIIYKVNEGGVAGRSAAIQAAMASWNNAGANFTFTYGGTHTQTDYNTNNNVNEIFWTSNLPKATLAMNVVRYNNISREILESDIGFNSAVTWSHAAICPPEQYDTQSTATHEMGHSLHLLDLYGDYPGYTQDTEKVMYGIEKPATIAKRTLHTHDILGIKWIYGRTVGFVAASVAGSGLLVYNPNTATWTQVTSDNPENIIYSGSTLYGDFGALGLWRRDGTAWSQLTSSNPENMVASGSTLYGDFGAVGLWRWNGSSWSQLSGVNPENMVASGSTLYGDFGAVGLWRWDGTAWSQLTWVNPENMVASGSTLYGDFGAVGLWRWNGSSWSQMSGVNPENMVASGSTLYGDFGAVGLWRWDGTAWSQLTWVNPENMVASGSTLYGDFGAVGLWRWNGTVWTQLTSSNVEIMVLTGYTLSGYKLYGDFGAIGLWKWDERSWSQLGGFDSIKMAVSN